MTQVQLLADDPLRYGSKGDIVEMPEWQADRWIARGSAAPVEGSEAVKADEVEEAENVVVTADDDSDEGINLSELSEDEDEDEDEDE